MNAPLPPRPAADPLPADPLPADLIDLLRCPLTRRRVRVERTDTGTWLVAERVGLRYPVRDGIPVMLIDEASLPAGVASLNDLKASLGLSDDVPAPPASAPPASALPASAPPASAPPPPATPRPPGG